MFVRRLSLVVALAGCACCMAGEETWAEQKREVLRRLEQLGTSLESVQTAYARKRWQIYARVVAQQLEWYPFIRGSSIRLGDGGVGNEWLQELYAWGDLGDAELPTPEQYRCWFEKVSHFLDGAQRLSATPVPPHRLTTARAQISRILSQRAYVHFADSGPGLMERLAVMLAQYVLRPLFGTQHRSEVTPGPCHPEHQKQRQ